MYTKGTNKVTSKTGIISITPPFLEKEGLFLTILNKEFSAVELLNAHLERIEKEDSKLNAFITVSKDIAINQAKHADKLIAEGQDLPLLGIPIALKDIFSKGRMTLMDTSVFLNTIPDKQCGCRHNFFYQ